MGMFDIIKMNIKCPFCGEESEMDVQTKDLSDTLKIFNVGDNVKDDIWFQTSDKLECTTDCHSKECVEFTNKKDGYVSGFGRIFELDVLLDDLVITDKYTITNIEP